MSEHRNKKKQLVSALVWRTMLWTLIICLFGSVSTFTVLLRAQEGFGVHDFPAIFVWTVFFSIAVVLSATVANPLTSRLPVTIKLVLFALLGVLLAMSAVLVTALLLGPWLRAFSIPLVLGWLVGAVSGLLGGGFYAHTKSAFHTVALSSLVTVLLVTGILLLNSEILAMEPVSVIPVRWEPDSGPTTASDNLQRILTDKESSLLTSLNLGGTFIVEGISTIGGLNARRRVVIVMQQQIAEPVKLALPRQGSVLYVQIHEDWLVVPPDVPMIKQGVLLTPSTDYYGQQYTDFSINVPGGVSDIGGFHWPTNDRE